MEMWLKRSTLLFFTVVVAAKMTSGQDTVILDHENTKRVKVPSGSLLNFICNLNTTGYERFRLNLYFNSSGPLFNKEHAISSKLVNKSSSKGRDNGQDNKKTFNHTLNATLNHSGFYQCEVNVEIPIFDSISSAAREVVVRPASPTEDSLLWLWIVLGVSAVILSVLLPVSILLRRRRSRSREEPIYANTHSGSKQPSPRMPADNLKMVPSSQNFRNPSPGRRYDEGKRRQRQ